MEDVLYLIETTLTDLLSDFIAEENWRADLRSFMLLNLLRQHSAGSLPLEFSTSKLELSLTGSISSSLKAHARFCSVSLLSGTSRIHLQTQLSSQNKKRNWRSSECR